MRLSSFTMLIGAGCLIAGLAACDRYVQTTSGETYLSGFAAAQPGNASVLDEAVREAASVEPLLRFPARIGLAKLGPQGIEVPSPEEVALWRGLGEELGSGFGEFLPVSPLVASYAAAAAGNRAENLWELSKAEQVGHYVREIQLGAARQHLDAVLVYTTASKQEISSNPLSILHLTIIGYWIAPSDDVEVRSVAQAMLMDVRNGYVYGYHEKTLEEPKSGTTVSGASQDLANRLSEEAKLEALQALLPGIRDLSQELLAQLGSAE